MTKIQNAKLSIILKNEPFNSLKQLGFIVKTLPMTKANAADGKYSIIVSASEVFCSLSIEI